jgi:hypothetical protein
VPPSLLRTPAVRFVACSTVAALALSGCGGGGGHGKPHPTGSTSRAATPTTPPPPTFTTDHVKSALLNKREIGSGIQQIDIAIESIRNGKVALCSLSGAKLPGKPQLGTRQYIKPNDKVSEVKYAQMVALYNDVTAAASAFSELKSKAISCPKKQHVPPKRVSSNFTLFAHDDTWKTSEDEVAGWTHLRGFEQQVYPTSLTKHNVFYYIYDYAVRGNLVFTSVYWERTDPGKSGDPIAKRASDLLTKQLQKIG